MCETRRVAVLGKKYHEQGPGFDMVEEYTGVFHGFSSDYEEFENGAVNYPVAIVEKDNGDVELVHAANIRFLKEI